MLLYNKYWIIRNSETYAHLWKQPNFYFWAYREPNGKNAIKIQNTAHIFVLLLMHWYWNQREDCFLKIPDECVLQHFIACDKVKWCQNVTGY